MSNETEVLQKKVSDQRAITVMIADDHPDMVDALVLRLSIDVAIDVVGTASDADEAIAVAARAQPDVALVDVRMPAGGGPRATRGIRERSPATRVVALTALEDRESILEMVRAGASGYLVKSTTGPELVDAVRRAASGQATLSGGVAAEVMGELAVQLERRAREDEERRLRAARIRSVLDGVIALRTLFQPITHLETGEVRGLEALARFGAEGGDPHAWFEDAGTVGLRRELEMHAMLTALEALNRIPESAYLSLNVSPVTITSPGFIEQLNGVAWSRIVLEITEHAAVDDYDDLGRAIDDVRDRGGRLAVDDAGAGFASLQHILRLRPDYIKLDIGLTRGVDSEPGKRALAEALIAFAPRIGASIIAEGVETEAQLQVLRELGVPHGQGFYLARPAPLPLTG